MQYGRPLHAVTLTLSALQAAVGATHPVPLKAHPGVPLQPETLVACPVHVLAVGGVQPPPVKVHPAVALQVDSLFV